VVTVPATEITRDALFLGVLILSESEYASEERHRALDIRPTVQFSRSGKDRSVRFDLHFICRMEPRVEKTVILPQSWHLQ
jgi:hypothetical protein